MPLAPAIAQLLTPTDPKPIHVYAGDRDVTSLVKWDTLSVSDSGSNAKGTSSMRLEAALSSLTELHDLAELAVYDYTSDTTVVRASLRSRQPVRGAAGYAAVNLMGDDLSSFLDDTPTVAALRPVESDRARISAFWGNIPHGSHLSGDLSQVAELNASLPEQMYAGMSLRQVVDSIAAQANPDADYYIGLDRRLHYFNASGLVAPFNIDTDSPGVGEFAPTDLDIDYDSGPSYANRVYVQGATPDASGYVQNDAAIAAAHGQVRTATLQASECQTLESSEALGRMYLGRVSTGKPRGSFSANSPFDGWAPGQMLTVTDSRLGLAAEPFRIRRVTRSLMRGGASPIWKYVVEFGGLRAGRT